MSIEYYKDGDSFAINNAAIINKTPTDPFEGIKCENRDRIFKRTCMTQQKSNTSPDSETASFLAERINNNEQEKDALLACAENCFMKSLLKDRIVE